MRTWYALGAVLCLGIGAMQACSGGGATSSSSGNGSNQVGTAQGGSSGVLTGQGGTTSVQQGAGGGTGGNCAETSSEAQTGFAPADIIIAVDTSGSMGDEAQWAQNNMNAMVQAIVTSGIDAHVVMLSDSTICVPAPLGSGSCPNDENLPNYRHVPQPIDSTDALIQFIGTYSQWQASLRSNATKTFVVISDDNSSMSANDFTNQLLALDPSFMGFKFDSIVSFQDPAACTLACGTPCNGTCGKCCPCQGFCPICFPNPISAAEGTVYKQLVTQTTGVIGDLCDQNFGPVFQDMATAVVTGSQIACVYDIPDPGMGQTLDKDKVNVDYQPNPNANNEPVYYVPGGIADCGPNGGWYYDDPVNPTQILFCPATCDYVQMSTEGKVTVKFGCETLVGPAE
jgi:hypothetical protein